MGILHNRTRVRRIPLSAAATHSLPHARPKLMGAIGFFTAIALHCGFTAIDQQAVGAERTGYGTNSRPHWCAMLHAEHRRGDSSDHLLRESISASSLPTIHKVVLPWK